MSYLQFEKSQISNLQESTRKEILRTNRSGAYSSSTITGLNTRKYHGLLVVPIPSLGTENHVLLSSLDETVIQHERSLILHCTSIPAIHTAPTDTNISVSSRGRKYRPQYTE